MGLEFEVDAELDLELDVGGGAEDGGEALQALDAAASNSEAELEEPAWEEEQEPT
jgi:hypothetical protein